MKLEIAIIENLQREDLNPIDRAKAFNRLYKEFGLKHTEIGKRVGKSREYVSNTLRILSLPENMQVALAEGNISEGHTRPLLMLMDRTEEQKALFQEILTRKLTVRDSEQVARRIATERARKPDLTPELLLLERELTDTLGTRVRIEKKDQGGKVLIDFFSVDDLAHIRALLSREQKPKEVRDDVPSDVPSKVLAEPAPAPMPEETEVSDTEVQSLTEKEKTSEDDMYSVRNFSV